MRGLRLRNWPETRLRQARAECGSRPAGTMAAHAAIKWKSGDLEEAALARIAAALDGLVGHGLEEPVHSGLAHAEL